MVKNKWGVFWFTIYSECDVFGWGLVGLECNTVAQRQGVEKMAGGLAIKPGRRLCMCRSPLA